MAGWNDLAAPFLVPVDMRIGAEQGDCNGNETLRGVEQSGERSLPSQLFGVLAAVGESLSLDLLIT